MTSSPVEKLRAALKPFKIIAETIEDDAKDGDDWFRFDGYSISCGDFRRAAEAYAALEAQPSLADGEK